MGHMVALIEALCYKSEEGRTMTLGSARPLTEMTTTNLPGGECGRPAHKADNRTGICEPMSRTKWEPRRLTTLGALCPVSVILWQQCGTENACYERDLQYRDFVFNHTY
jgi:hypothetical protein